MFVSLTCVKQGARLRVRITSPGYLPDANCQFPRALRQDGREFRVPASAISLATGPRGKYFYRVRAADITTVAPGALGAPKAPEAPEAAHVHLKRVYDVGEECVICMDEPKTLIMVPCGHYCMCRGCHAQLPKKVCPVCRVSINTVITPDQVA